MSTKFDGTAAAPAAAVIPSDIAFHEARRSHRVSGDNVAANDGDIWQEKLAVCEGSTDAGEPRLIIRSYYRNTRTLDRVWDEPPSGAGTVLHADQEMRSKAELQKQEIQLTLEMIPPEEDEKGGSKNDKPKKKGLFGRFARKKKEKKHVDTSRDLNLQRAIARSMADQIGGGGGAGGDDDGPLIYFDDGVPSDLMREQQQSSSKNYGSKQQEDEDIELAKALSMSVETAQRQSRGDVDFGVSLTEEEMFQRALQKSREESVRGATGVASKPDPSFASLEDSSTSFSASPRPAVKIGVKTDPNERYDGDENDMLDQKLPAAPILGSTPRDPPADNTLKKFDPYA